MTTLSELCTSSNKKPIGLVDAIADDYKDEYREFVRNIQLGSESDKVGANQAPKPKSISISE